MQIETKMWRLHAVDETDVAGAIAAASCADGFSLAFKVELVSCARYLHVHIDDALLAEHVHESACRLRDARGFGSQTARENLGCSANEAMTGQGMAVRLEQACHEDDSFAGELLGGLLEMLSQEAAALEVDQIRNV